MITHDTKATPLVRIVYLFAATCFVVLAIVAIAAIDHLPRSVQPCVLVPTNAHVDYRDAPTSDAQRRERARPWFVTQGIGCEAPGSLTHGR